MNKRMWMNLVMAVLVAGLFMTVSCAKKTVVAERATVEDQAKADAEAKARAEAEAARIRAQELEDQKAKEMAMQQAKQAAAKARFVNQNIHFEYDSAELTTMAKMLLKEKAEWLAANPGVSVTIQGHCDERGTTEYNLALGERRALAARNYLADLGVSAGRMNMVSFGEEQPLDPGKNEAAYRKNRRAQFIIQ